MVTTPLASSTDFNNSPFNNMARSMVQAELDRTMLAASRAAEGLCRGARLMPFTTTETTRLQDTDVEESVSSGMPLPAQSQMGLDYATALSMPVMVRHFWVRHYPRTYAEMWTGVLTAVSISWPYQTAPFVVPITSIAFDADTGHARFNLGTFSPPGSTAIITYTGGYTTTPDDLRQAVLLLAAAMLTRELDPNEQSSDPEVLRNEANDLLVAYGGTGRSRKPS